LLTKLDLALAKWVFLPLFCLGTVFLIANVWFRDARCARLCAEKGFYSHTYTPRRYRLAGECYCHTQEEIRESKAKNRPPTGGARIF